MKSILVSLIICSCTTISGICKDVLDFSKIIDYDSIMVFCKSAISANDPKIDIKDLKIHQIEYISDTGDRTPYLKVSLIQPSTKVVKPIEGSDKWESSYQGMSMFIMRDGVPKESKLQKVSFGFAHSTKPEN